MIGGSVNDWKWLVKLCYDRRAEVRNICLDLIDLVLTVDNDDNTNTNNDNDDDINSINWPPYDSMKLIIIDKNECSSVRLKAARILAKSCLSSSSLSSLSSSSSGLIGQIIMSLHDTLDMSNPRCNISSIKESLSIITMLLSSSSSSSSSLLSIETLKCIISMKVLPQIISILNPTAPSIIQNLATARVGLNSNTNSNTNSNSNSNSGGRSGWRFLWYEYLKENESNLVSSSLLLPSSLSSSLSSLSSSLSS